MADASAAPNEAEAPQPIDSAPEGSPMAGTSGTPEEAAAMEAAPAPEPVPAPDAPAAAASEVPSTGVAEALTAPEPSWSLETATAPATELSPAEASPAPVEPFTAIAPPMPADAGTQPQPVAPATPSTPSVATTIEVPALDSEGGEWELLVGKVRQWLASGQLSELIATARTPLSLLAVVVAALVLLQIVGSLLDVLHELPLVPGLLELVGVVAVVRFSLTRLVRSSDRRQVIDDLRSRWKAFRGEA